MTKETSPRRVLNKAGLPLFFMVIVFSIVKEYVVVPLMSGIWKITLMTSPEGFISNANLGRTLLKSPWIILIGAALLGGFLLFSMWQVAATILGVAYAYEGKNARIRDLLIISGRKIKQGTKLRNIMLVVFTAIILPFTNIYRATDMFGAFIVPEYIQDFIESKRYLYIIYLALFILGTYYALRLLYVLPGFFMKETEFRKVSKESFEYTRKKTMNTGIRLVFYNFIESIRLAIFPYVVVIIACTLVYIGVYDRPYATELFTRFPLAMAKDFLSTFCGVMVYLSTLCFVVIDYYRFNESLGTLQEIQLPELEKESKHYISGRSTDIIFTLLATLGIVVFYLITVWSANENPELFKDVMHSPAVVAHKGYSSKAPENTMDAFALADQADSVDYIELDVWSTKDGVPVVIHNSSITQATGLSGNVYDYTYEELKNIPAPYKMDAKEFPNARIPSLEEVIATYAKTTPLIIEIKGYREDEQLPAKIVALMEQYDITSTSMIHSGNYAALKAVKMCNPSIKCGLIQALVTGNCYDLPYADFLSVEHTFVSKQMVNQLHKRDKEIYVWTVNYKESVDSLRTLSVDGYITDCPDDIATSIREGYTLENIFNEDLREEQEKALEIENFNQDDY